MSIVNCLEISSDNNQAVNNYMNAEFGNVSSAIAYNSRIEMTDIIDHERNLNILSIQEVEKMNKS